MLRSKYTTEELIAGITDKNIHPEFDWGPDVGREILPLEPFYGIGDATLPQGNGPCIIAHVCNDLGQWGKGFVLPLGKRYPDAEKAYREWAKRKTNPLFALGQVQFVEVSPQLWVANMIGQHGIFKRGGEPPIRYDALRECLRSVCVFAAEHQASVQMPRIGCGLAGGKWEAVGPIVEAALTANGVQVMVCDLPMA